MLCPRQPPGGRPTRTATPWVLLQIRKRLTTGCSHPRIGISAITTIRCESLTRLLPEPLPPAMAKVLAEGKPSPGGFYWQKVEKSNGSIQYLCRKTSDSKIQKAAACNGAKAVKP